MDIETLLARADALKAEIDALRPLDPEKERRVWQKFALDWSYHSNALEGNQVSLGETEMFLQYGLTAKGRPFKDYMDIRGHSRAIEILRDLVRRKDPITEGVLRELHKALLGEPQQVEAETAEGLRTTKVIIPGEYKTQPNHVKTPGGGVHYYVDPRDTPAKMAELVLWWREQSQSGELHPAIIASHIHHRFTAIHPFDDGNGRMARLLSNLVLMQSGFPPAVIKTQKRDEYIFALRAADQGDLGSLTEILLTELINSEELMLRGARGEPVEELDDIDKQIALLKQELHHIDEPLELTAESAHGAYVSLLRPVLETLAQKLSSFGDFFSQTVVTVDGNFTEPIAVGRQSQALHPNRLGGIAEVVPLISTMMDGKTRIPSHFNLLLQWREFRKTPMHPLALDFHIAAVFEKLRYTLKVGAKQYAWAYVAHATGEEIRNVAEAACLPLIGAIRSHIQAHISQ